MARAREVPGLDCDDSFSRAAVRVIEARGAEVFEHADGVLDVEDIEPVHDMRVATRRLRAAMEVFKPCFPPKQHRKALKRVKKLADALGERRDRDVAIAFLNDLAGGLPDADRKRLDAVLDGQREEQRRANEELAPFVGAKRLKKLRRRLDRLVKAAAP